MKKSAYNFGIFCLVIFVICEISLFFIPNIYIIVPITFGIIFGIFGYLFGIDYKNVK